MTTVTPPTVRRAPLAGLLAASVVSLTGNMLTLIALPLYVLQTTGSATATGITGFFATLPVVIGGPFGGVVVDRIGYRRASALADVVSGLTMALVPLFAHLVGLPFWALIALVFASGLLDTPGQTARGALLPEAAEAAGVPIERAMGWFQAAERGARMLGAPTAGLLVAAMGALNVLVLDAVSFAVSAVLILRLVPWTMNGATSSESAAAATPDEDARATTGVALDGGGVRGYWREFTEGLRFTVRDPLLRAVILLVLVTNFFDAAKSSVFLPIYAQRMLDGSVAFGVLVGAMGGGALAGSLVYSAIGHRLPRRATFIVAFVLAGGPPFLALAIGLGLPALVGVYLVAGFAAGAINPIIGVVMLQRIPAGMRARVYGIVGAGCWAAMPLGSLAAGLAAQHGGLRISLLAAGIAYIIVSLLPALGGAWREMDRHSPPTDVRADVVTEKAKSEATPA